MDGNEASARERIVDAFLSLLREKRFAEISVTDIASRAGVSRMAYYRNFASKTRILDAFFTRVGERIHAEISGLADARRPQAYLTALFSSLKPYCEIGQAVAEAQMGELIQKHIQQNMQSTFSSDGSAFSRYRQCFLSGALCQVVLNWVTTGMHESADEMAGYCCRLIPAEIWT